MHRAALGLAPVFDPFAVGVFCLHRDARFTPLSLSAAELARRRIADLARGLPAPARSQRGATRRELDEVFWRRDGIAGLVTLTGAPWYEPGEHVGAIVEFADGSERRREVQLRRAGSTRQAAVAELGLRALGGAAPKDLLQHASAEVARTLGVEFCEVFELVDQEHGLRLVAGVGWRPGTIGTAHVGLAGDSPAGFALTRDQPVVVDDWHTEVRFGAPDLLRDHGVRSGVSVVIHGRDRPWGTEPWGVVGVHSASPRRFSVEDLPFLQSVANTLALAIGRSDAECEVSMLAAERQRIMADALDAEDRTRERISQLLHDDVLQSLLAARQDLAGAERAGRVRRDAVGQAREAVAEAITELRNAVTALHPATRVQGGLAEAIKAIADVHARRAGFDVSLNVESGASGVRDQLIVSLAQELLANAAQHSEAGHVAVMLLRTRDDIVFEVCDNGCGMDPGRPREALGSGHLGLASIAMRVEACGGRFQLDSRPGGGTRVRVTLPAPAVPDVDDGPSTANRRVGAS